MNALVYSNCYFGSHISFKGKLYDTLEHALETRMYSIQFFLGNRLSLKRSTLTDNDVSKSNTLLKTWDINTFTHIPYMINFAGKGGKLGYSDDEEVNSYVTTCVESVQQELNTLRKIETSKKGCVLHIGSVGSHPNRKSGLDCVVQSINRLNISDCTPLCLETMVGRGGVLGTTFEELEYIITSCKHTKGKVKICIDTCHLFAEGLYNLSRHEEIDRCFKDVHSLFGNTDIIQCVHFNDSECEYKSKQDKHARIGSGHIFKQEGKQMSDSVRYFIDKCELYRIPTILETVEDDYSLVVDNLR